MKPQSTDQAPQPKHRESADEPEITQEESVPSDGKDKEGEKQMEELGREREAKEAPGS